MQLIRTEGAGKTDHPTLPGIMRFSTLLIFLVFILAFTACNRGTIYETGKAFRDQLWHKDSTLVFKPVVEDTSQVINIGFSLEHNNDYPYSNLWLFVDVESPDGKMQTDTIEYFLAEPDGQWIGKGSDKERTLYWLYRRDVKLSSPGQLTFSVTQGMRRDELPGIQSFSLWIEKAELSEDSSER
ncbi:gliding motility lipoprotein GldH [Anaerophaga thermohalophila]|uniref:gliding motility lipoprotein GldH n=1 Tax=Anaerophaga thermohalophila TaxID=177400 RepID=UPI001FDF0D57|nr:gliding motility lipoprotein GldH [Anaerophaga thermohalophila]